MSQEHLDMADLWREATRVLHLERQPRPGLESERRARAHPGAVHEELVEVSREARDDECVEGGPVSEGGQSCGQGRGGRPHYADFDQQRFQTFKGSGALHETCIPTL